MTAKDEYLIEIRQSLQKALNKENLLGQYLAEPKRTFLFMASEKDTKPESIRALEGLVKKIDGLLEGGKFLVLENSIAKSL